MAAGFGRAKRPPGPARHERPAVDEAALLVARHADRLLAAAREAGDRRWIAFLEPLPDRLRDDEIRALLSGRRVAVFLDYDGTLTPIVERPEDALLPAETRGAIQRLAALAPVAIVSGRDLAEARRSRSSTPPSRRAMSSSTRARCRRIGPASKPGVCCCVPTR